MTREKAIKIVKEFINGTCLHLVDQEALETLIPELKENEDEKIRHWLIGLISADYKDENFPSGIKKTDVLNWLKKESVVYEQGMYYYDGKKFLYCQQEKPKVATPTPDSVKQNKSEDDSRIIDDLIGFVTDYGDNYYGSIAKANVLSWLEKQKEQKPVESISQRTVQGKGVYKICPRCKERMIRDDSMVYTSMPPQYRYECPKCGESECDTVMYDNPEMEEQKPNIELIQQSWYMEGYHDREFGKEPKWILKTDKGGPKHELNPKYGQFLQKPAEWSEEDKEALDMCIDAIPKAWKTKSGTLLTDWLKEHLRPSWKPSEEQMKALLNIEGDLRAFQYNDKAKIIAELYEQLKRL